jgi:hypothetical protein
MEKEDDPKVTESKAMFPIMIDKLKDQMKKDALLVVASRTWC